MSEPRPIETAPKDRRILLYIPGAGAWADAWWFGTWNYLTEEWILSVPTTAAGKQVHLWGYKPTHWLSSPDPPVR